MRTIHGKRVALIGVTSLLIALFSGCASDDGGQSNADPVLTGAGDDRLPNETASDLVTFADHIAVVTVSGEEELPVPQEDIDRGEGLVSRTVTMTVDQVLWSHASAQEAPKAVQWRVLGWTFKESPDNRVVTAMESAPRFEVGHTYIVALDWEQPDCDGEGRWTTLGGSFNLPFDDSTIGIGEFEGRLLTAEDLPKSTPRGSGLRAQLWGKSSADIVNALRDAEPNAELASQLKAAEADC